MTDKNRRSFLKLTALSVGVASLPACGGSGAHGITSALEQPQAEPTPTTAPIQAPVANPEPSPVATPPSVGPIEAPAWLTGSVVGQWAQVTGTAAPTELKDYCGVAWREEHSVVQAISAAAGGHGGNLTNNRVMAINLAVSNPSWTQLRAADASEGWNSSGADGAYFGSSKPAPRHTYSDIWYEPALGRVLLGGAYWGSGAYTWNVVDGFRLTDNDWDAAGTFPNRPSSGAGAEARDPLTGVQYILGGENGGRKWMAGSTPASSSFQAWPLSGSPTTGYLAYAFDTRRRQIFHLCAGNGNAGSGTTPTHCCKVSLDGVKTAVAFSTSPAWTDWQANTANFGGEAMVYDQDADCFYWYNGGPEGTQKIYRIHPNDTDTWTMDFVPVTGVTPTASIGPNSGGCYTKFHYVSQWRTCILIVPGQDVYFLRLA